MPKAKYAIKEAKEKGTGRKFTQSIDLVVSVRHLDLKKAENKFSLEVMLPSGRGKKARVGVIGSNLALKVKGVADVILNEKEFGELERDPKKVRSFSQSIDFVVAEAPLMMRIGKSLGKVLGPRGKMPKPLPPHADATPVINKLKETVKVSLKDNPTISCTIGTEKMSDDELLKNLNAMLSALEKKFPLGKQNMKEVLVKATMGPPVKVDY